MDRLSKEIDTTLPSIKSTSSLVAEDHLREGEGTPFGLPSLNTSSIKTFAEQEVKPFFNQLQNPIRRLFIRDQEDGASTPTTSTTTQEGSGNGADTPTMSTAQNAAFEKEALALYHKDLKEAMKTLQQMFPQMEKDIIRDLVIQHEGRIGPLIEICLDLTK